MRLAFFTYSEAFRESCIFANLPPKGTSPVLAYLSWKGATCHGRSRLACGCGPLFCLSMEPRALLIKNAAHLSGVLFVAEEVGFEPTDARTSTVFKTAALSHSAIPPYVKASQWLAVVHHVA